MMKVQVFKEGSKVSKDFIECRIELADKILKYVEPLVCEKIKQKNQDLKEGQETKKKLKQSIEDGKLGAKKLLLQLKREQQVSELLKSIDVLVRTGIVYGQVKRNITSLLERLETLNYKQLTKAKKTVDSMLKKQTTKEEFV